MLIDGPVHASGYPSPGRPWIAGSIVETFGHERVVWGADYPNVSDVATYEGCVTWLDHVDGLDASAREWFRGRATEDALDR